jgi:ABC-type transport system substrate-binding protein
MGFDPHLVVNNHKIMTNLLFTHSRLVRIKSGASVVPGTLPIEADLAESWTQPSETTYVFNLRKGVRWHSKAPVNGRELTAEDVKYTYDRFLGVKGNPNRVALEHVEKVEALDRHTVKFTLKEPPSDTSRTSGSRSGAIRTTSSRGCRTSTRSRRRRRDDEDPTANPST